MFLKSYKPFFSDKARKSKILFKKNTFSSGDAFTLKDSTPEEKLLLSKRHAHNFRVD